jgi:hypothetical protein
MLQSISLIPLALFLFIVAGHEGENRARRAEARLDHLPYMSLAYKSDGCTNACHLWGKLLFRTEKIVCVTRVNGQEVCGTYITDGLEDRIFTIPVEKIVYISTFLPPGITQTTGLSDKKENP